jgi:hypothetical protein
MEALERSKASPHYWANMKATPNSSAA